MWAICPGKRRGKDIVSKKKAIIVAGMHRSGTSAVAGVLSLLGAGFGKDMIGPSHDNKKGFFENNNISRTNDLIMQSLGSPWDSLTPFPGDWWKNSSSVPFNRRLTDIVNNEFEDEFVFAIKDPRICRLLPLWKDVLESLEIEFSFIIPVRSPVEVAKSLQKRNNLTIEKSALLWTDYTLQAEFYSRGHERAIFPFDDLLISPERTLEYICDQCGFGSRETISESMGKIREFLEPGLKHHNLGSDDREYLIPIVVRTYETILNLSYKDDPESRSLVDLDILRLEFPAVSSFFYPPGFEVCIGWKKDKKSSSGHARDPLKFIRDKVSELRRKNRK
jgi:hypothetical protein